MQLQYVVIGTGLLMVCGVFWAMGARAGARHAIKMLQKRNPK